MLFPKRKDGDVETVARPVPPIDLQVPTMLSTAAFGVG